MVLAGCSFGMRGVDPSWDRTQEPACTDSYIPVAVDGLTASLISGVVSQNEKEGKYPLDTSVIVASILVSLVYTVSAVNGARKYNECRVARADWHAREAIRVGNADAEARSRSAPSPPAALWCFDGDGKQRCFTTQRVCEAQVEKVVAVSRACVERP
jgi:hypothetical protein